MKTNVLSVFLRTLSIQQKYTIDDKKIKKRDFYNENKKIFNINDIDVNKILVSKKEKYGKYNSFKYFIG